MGRWESLSPILCVGRYPRREGRGCRGGGGDDVRPASSVVVLLRATRLDVVDGPWLSIVTRGGVRRRWWHSPLLQRHCARVLVHGAVLAPVTPRQQREHQCFQRTHVAEALDTKMICLQRRICHYFISFEG